MAIVAPPTQGNTTQGNAWAIWIAILVIVALVIVAYFDGPAGGRAINALAAYVRLALIRNGFIN